MTLIDTIRKADSAERDISRSNSLRKCKNVRLDAVTLQTKPASGPAKTRDDFVRDEQHIVLVADLSNPREIVVRRNDQSPRTLNRLGDKCGHRFRPFLQNHLFEQICRGDTRSHRRIVGNKSIRIRRLDMQKARKLAPKHGPERRQSRGAHGRHGHAVIAEVAADNLGFLRLSLGNPEKTGCLERGFVGLAATGSEEEVADGGITGLTKFRQASRPAVPPARLSPRRSRIQMQEFPSAVPRRAPIPCGHDLHSHSIDLKARQ